MAPSGGARLAHATPTTPDVGKEKFLGGFLTPRRKLADLSNAKDLVGTRAVNGKLTDSEQTRGAVPNGVASKQLRLFVAPLGSARLSNGLAPRNGVGPARRSSPRAPKTASKDPSLSPPQKTVAMKRSGDTLGGTGGSPRAWSRRAGASPLTKLLQAASPKVRTNGSSSRSLTRSGSGRGGDSPPGWPLGRVKGVLDALNCIIPRDQTSESEAGHSGEEGPLEIEGPAVNSKRSVPRVPTQNSLASSRTDYSDAREYWADKDAPGNASLAHTDYDTASETSISRGPLSARFPLDVAGLDQDPAGSSRPHTPGVPCACGVCSAFDSLSGVSPAAERCATESVVGGSGESFARAAGASAAATATATTAAASAAATAVSGASRIASKASREHTVVLAEGERRSSSGPQALRPNSASEALKSTRSGPQGASLPSSASPPVGASSDPCLVLPSTGSGPSPSTAATAPALPRRTSLRPRSAGRRGPSALCFQAGRGAREARSRGPSPPGEGGEVSSTFSLDVKSQASDGKEEEEGDEGLFLVDDDEFSEASWDPPLESLAIALGPAAADALSDEEDRVAQPVGCRRPRKRPWRETGAALGVAGGKGAAAGDVPFGAKGSATASGVLMAGGEAQESPSSDNSNKRDSGVDGPTDGAEAKETQSKSAASKARVHFAWGKGASPGGKHNGRGKAFRGFKAFLSRVLKLRQVT